MIALIGNNDQLENSSYPLEGRLEQDQENNAYSAGGPGGPGCQCGPGGLGGPGGEGGPGSPGGPGDTVTH